MNLSRRPLRVRTATAAVVLGAALALTGCGLNAQTLQPYTPAHGVNVDDGAVKVRNLLIVADDKGHGVLSGSFTTDKSDVLAAVAGTALRADGTKGSTLTVTGAPVKLTENGLAVLTASDNPIRVQGADLKPGLLAEVQLTFGSGLAKTVTVPVLSTTDPIYSQVASQVTPSATPTPVAVETPAASPSPTHSR